MERTYVIIYEDDDIIFSMGVEKDIEKAWGKVMTKIWSDKEEFEQDNDREEGDSFKYGDPYYLEADAGYGINVEYAWATGRKYIEHFYILFNDEEEKEVKHDEQNTTCNKKAAPQGSERQKT